MRWKNRERSANVSDRRGGGKAVAGGGLGLIGIAVVVALLGGDPTPLLQEGIKRTVIEHTGGQSKIPEAEQDELVEFVSVVLAETEDTWSRKFVEKGRRYSNPVLVLFTGQVTSGCGMASAAVGPFYCPVDQKIYLDLDFFYDLRKRHDAPGDFAQAYVIAHEVGHHIQNLTGVLDEAEAAKRRTNQVGANKISVKTELMADCLAGAWAADTRAKGLLEDGDIEEALNAASQIGDDTLQKQGQGYVVPDSFTHGSSAQRFEWFNRGFKNGDVGACEN